MYCMCASLSGCVCLSTVCDGDEFLSVRVAVLHLVLTDDIGPVKLICILENHCGAATVLAVTTEMGEQWCREHLVLRYFA